jgi:hypothetical protein
MRKKRKIELLLPLVGERRAREMRRELAELNALLGLPPGADPKVLLESPTASSGVDGVGGLRFEAQSPPGLGRLIRLPFYMTAYEGPVLGAVLTDGGLDTPAVANPSVLAAVPVGLRALTGMVFTTPQVAWADLRVVGFQAPQTPFTPVYIDPHPGAPIVQTLRPFLLVKDLFVGGGANLFAQEGYVDAAVFTNAAPEFAGLRQYPLLTSPNVANVRAAVSGQSVAVPVSTPSIVFSLVLVCEVLDDQNHGRHIPGPYARRDALIRVPPREGGFPREG